MTFLNPLDALIPKNPIFFFADFWVWVTSEARGSVSVGFWGSRQLSPFWGGSSQGALSPPPLNYKPVHPCISPSGRFRANFIASALAHWVVPLHQV